MKTRLSLRWAIVVCLLAALPGLTAVMAQGQEPVGKQAPVVDEQSESVDSAYSYWESEPNNSMGQAQEIALGDAVGAMFSPADSDNDYFKFYVAQSGTAILIDTDLGESEADTTVTLYNISGRELGQNDDADGLNSMLYRVVLAGWYYIEVENYQYNECTLCTYELYVSSPLLISAAAAKLGKNPNVEGIPFESRDILAYSELADDHNGNAQHKWVMFLDATDINFTKSLVNLSTGGVCYYSDCGTLAVTFGANQTLVDAQGIKRTAKPWDWVTFEIDQVGTNTAISNIEVHSGAPHGLTTASEKLDALAVVDMAIYGGSGLDLYFSTVGAARVPLDGGGTLKIDDDDFFLSRNVSPSGWISLTNCDGRTLLGTNAEDVFAADMNTVIDNCYVTILGTGVLWGHSVTQMDIILPEWDFVFNGVTWHGPDHGWNYNIDAFDWPGH
jgi:hypothetical protein